MDIKNILKLWRNAPSSELEANREGQLKRPINASTLAKVSGASGQPHTVTVVDLKKFPHLRVSLGNNIILELDLISPVGRKPLDTYGTFEPNNFEIRWGQSPGTRVISSSDSIQKKVQAPTRVKSEYEYEYEVSSEEENGVPVDARRTEDTESSETSRSVPEAKSEESGKEESVETSEDFSISDSADSNNFFAKEPESGIEGTNYTCTERSILPSIAKDKEKSEASQSAIFSASSDSNCGGSLSETNRTNLVDGDDPIAYSESKTFLTEDFTELLGKLYERFQEVEAAGKKYMDLITELEKKIAELEKKIASK